MNPFHSKSFAIDLGNNNTLLTDNENILLSQATCIVFDKQNNSVKAIGDEAYSIFEKSHHDLKTVKPLRGGVIADYDSATTMIHEMVAKVFSKMTRFKGFDTIISGVPFSTTEVERRALRNSLEQFRSRRSNLIFEPLAAAMGMGLDIREPEGKMIVDIGGGITEIVVISLSGIAVFQSTKTAGDTFSEEIRDYFRRSYGMAIGLKTAEQIKIGVGSVVDQLTDPPPTMLVRGKDIQEGIPISRKIDFSEVSVILNKSIISIEECIIQALEVCPPELAADIYSKGIFITGGGALLRGIKQRLERKIGLPVHVDAHPLLSVSKGISKTLHSPAKFKSILI